MPYHLITGATGLLGEYLLRDLSSDELKLAVIARSSAGTRPGTRISADARIDGIMRRWERQAGHSLPRPVVIEGDLREPDLGLGPDALAWVSRHCDTLVHNAASLKFSGQDRSREPWRSNLDGTRNMLGLCQKTGIKKLFHVSTAYISGDRQGTIKESEVDVGQASGNDYEASKLAAELLVRSAEHLDQITVLRPSIIAGDSQTGYTSTFHGFYFPLKAGHAFSDGAGSSAAPFPLAWLLASMGLTGDERKNVVPVDWVASAVKQIVCDPSLHGQTYHLTSADPITLSDMAEVMMQAIHTSQQAGQSSQNAIQSSQPAGEADADSAISLDQFESQFRLQMTAYRSYWRDDPEFCNANVLAVSGIKPCPKIDTTLMERLCRYAIRNKFSTREFPSVPPPIDARSLFGSQLGIAVRPGNASIGFQVNGPGGGQWQADWIHSRLQGISVGIHSSCRTTLYFNTTTLRRIAAAELDPPTALASGAVYVRGDSETAIGALAQVSDLAQSLNDH